MSLLGIYHKLIKTSNTTKLTYVKEIRLAFIYTFRKNTLLNVTETKIN